uniref:ERCC4 domain-containing protein n=1 Tax=Parastrongyloides trichosuri TaxID=131310 RepID=A0A0N4ZA93_PARTI
MSSFITPMDEDGPNGNYEELPPYDETTDVDLIQINIKKKNLFPPCVDETKEKEIKKKSSVQNSRLNKKKDKMVLTGTTQQAQNTLMGQTQHREITQQAQNTLMGQTKHMEITQQVQHTLMGQTRNNNGDKNFDSSLFSSIYMHCIENHQIETKLNQEIDNKANIVLSEALKILRTQNGNERELLFFSNNYDKALYSFLADCYITLIPQSIRKKDFSSKYFLECFLNNYSIQNFKLDDKRLQNICRSRIYRIKKTHSTMKNESKEVLREKAILRKLVKITSTSELCILCATNAEELEHFRTSFMNIFDHFVKTVPPRMKIVVPSILKIKGGCEKVLEYKKIYDPISDHTLENGLIFIQKKFNLKEFFPSVRKVCGNSNGIYRQYKNDKRTYIFFIGTMPLFTNTNFDSVMECWIKFNIMTKNFKIPEHHKELYQLIMQLSNVHRSRTTKGRSEPLRKVTAAIQEIENILSKGAR